MSAKRDAKREDLRRRLIDAAEKRMSISGLTGLRARDVTSDAGCALGGLYTVFNDLDDLILHVNARTLDKIGEAMHSTTQDLVPNDALLAVALEYARFARDNRPIWDALFDHNLPGGTPVPDWFRRHQQEVMRHVVEPLAAIRPDLSEDVLHLRARTYFSALHGIVSVSLQGRFVGIPSDELDNEIKRFIEHILTDILASGRVK